jgi:hypothetical protein
MTGDEGKQNIEDGQGATTRLELNNGGFQRLRTASTVLKLRIDRSNQKDISRDFSFTVQKLEYPLDYFCSQCAPQDLQDAVKNKDDFIITDSGGKSQSSPKQQSPPNQQNCLQESYSKFKYVQLKLAGNIPICKNKNCIKKELLSTDESDGPYIEVRKNQNKLFRESRKIVECRRIYSISTDNELMEKLDLNGIEKEIIEGTYKNRAFVVCNNNLFGHVLYLIESISQNPDKSYILTLSAGFYNKFKALNEKIETNFNMDLHLRMIHKMIPSEYIDKGLKLLLPTTSTSLTIEIATNHPHLFFARMDSVFIQWEKSPQGMNFHNSK